MPLLITLCVENRRALAGIFKEEAQSEPAGARSGIFAKLTGDCRPRRMQGRIGSAGGRKAPRRQADLDPEPQSPSHFWKGMAC